MRLLVCGDRNWTDRDAIRKALYVALREAEGDLTVIHGGCRGADTIAGEEAKDLGIDVEVFRADWQRYGRGAGPIRNEQMLVEGQPDRALAFHHNIDESRGTKNMITQLTWRGIPYVLKNA